MEELTAELLQKLEARVVSRCQRCPSYGHQVTLKGFRAAARAHEAECHPELSPRWGIREAGVSSSVIELLEPVVMHHGTSPANADAIFTEGLRPGSSGFAYVTDHIDQSYFYAVWRSIRDLERPWEPQSELGRRAVAMEAAKAAPIGAVVDFELPAGSTLVWNRSWSPPPPWFRATSQGEAWMSPAVLPADLIVKAVLYPIPELNDPALAEACTRDAHAWTRLLDHPDEDLFAAAIQPWLFLEAVTAASGNVRSPYHGEHHWLRVADAGLRLLEAGCLADPVVVFAFAVLHDSQRQGEGHDPAHGRRAARLVEELPSECLRLSDAQRAQLAAALGTHMNGLVSDDPTIGACWDADRLTLARFGATPDLGYLSTAEGKALAAAAADWLSDECDWGHTMYRYSLSVTGAPGPTPPATSDERADELGSRSPAQTA